LEKIIVTENGGDRAFPHVAFQAGCPTKGVKQKLDSGCIVSSSLKENNYVIRIHRGALRNITILHLSGTKK
jgi:hypothetical protein